MIFDSGYGYSNAIIAGICNYIGYISDRSAIAAGC
jgi:hypothetical protein